MAESLKRHYLKEEEFLDEFSASASAAASFLGGEWEPEYHCDDDVRRARLYSLSTGDLERLVFDSAAVFHDATGFSSVQTVLLSSTRLVTVRVTGKNTDHLVAEKVVDRAREDTSMP